MTQQIRGAENEIKALIEAWAVAVRRHDLPAILAHHEHAIVMFDVPPPFQSRGLDAYTKPWDLFFLYHERSQAFDIEEVAITAGEDVAFAVLVMRCGSATGSGRPLRDFYDRLPNQQLVRKGRPGRRDAQNPRHRQRREACRRSRRPWPDISARRGRADAREVDTLAQIVGPAVLEPLEENRHPVRSGGLPVFVQHAPEVPRDRVLLGEGQV